MTPIAPEHHLSGGAGPFLGSSQRPRSGPWRCWPGGDSDTSLESYRTLLQSRTCKRQVPFRGPCTRPKGPFSVIFQGRKVMVSERVSGMSKLGHSVLLGPGPAFSKEALGRLGEGAQGPSQAAAACEQLFCDSGFPFLSQLRPQLHFYHSPLFQRDCPHLLVRMKPRVHTKPASGQVDGEPAAPGHLPAPSAAEPQDGLPPSPEHIQGTPSYPQLDHASALAGTDSVAPAPPRTAAEPPTPDRSFPTHFSVLSLDFSSHQN